ncbi:MAG: 4Fe-4S cluster-binding domain-containing protein, partial [Prevotella sp.]|nr:4Fe-4S cluster-binding domain-containing protein [Prevotella sp.]
ESLIQDDQRELLANIDVLVDGPFIERLKDPDLLFRGSSNQRIINVPASIYEGHVVLWKPDVSV